MLYLTTSGPIKKRLLDFTAKVLLVAGGFKSFNWSDETADQALDSVEIYRVGDVNLKSRSVHVA